MELWLIVGAFILIALTVWIVWSPQTSRQAEEPTMNDVNKSTPTSQAEQIQERAANTTAAGVGTASQTTADAVSAARDTATGVQAQAERTGSTSSEPWSAPGLAREGTTQPWSAAGTATVDSTTGQRGMMPPKKTMGIGATTLVAVAGGIGGAWLYQRRRERNKPINRLRRGAFDLADRLNQRLPETDLPGGRTGPVGGAGVALVLSSLIIARALRRQPEPTLESRVEETRGLLGSAFALGRDEATRRLQRANLERALEQARKRKDDLPQLSMTDVPKQQAVFGGLGLGGMLLLGGVCYVIWRIMRGGGETNPAYYRGETISS